MSDPISIRVIDSHTGGEPTRVVIDGAPICPTPGALAARDFLAAEADWLRRALILEPRGFEAIVGAYLCEPTDSDCVTGVVFFNNVACLNSCLHGTIGLVKTLEHLGRITPGVHKIETPVGVIEATLSPNGTVTVSNVPCYRLVADQQVEVPNYGPITGEIAWGGNWFFLIQDQGPPVRFDHLDELTAFTPAVWRQASIIGTCFSGQFTRLPDSQKVTPVITGSAHVTGESTFILDPRDPFQFGINP